MVINQNEQDLIKKLGGSGSMSSIAYDTAWVARLSEIDGQLGHRALDWICTNQLPDGSWGARTFYYHDRVISTLAAMIALNRGRRSSDRIQIQRGQTALERITAGATMGLENDSNGATVGFEMIAPTLTHEAESLGLIQNQGSRILGRLAGARQRKLSLLQGKLINRHITAAFSAEMAGTDGLQKLDIGQLREENGSVGHSPAATVYYLLQIDPNNKGILTYIKHIANQDGGFPDLIPFEVFEIAWTIWNFYLAWGEEKPDISLFRPHLDYLWKHWKTGQGIGLSAGYSIPDGDDTAIVFELLTRSGYSPDIEAVLSFEETDHFRTYHFEANSSTSVASHILSAFRYAGFKRGNPHVLKALAYLQQKRTMTGFWSDKWNLSPYYTTAHVVIACAGFVDEMVEASINWILFNQNSDGSWGKQFPSAEETAYCLQALCSWGRYKYIPPTVKDSIRKAYDWLSDKTEPPYPPLWIGKGLYCPELVVNAAIMSAIKMAREIRGS